jgi:hypothetical protein
MKTYSLLQQRRRLVVWATLGMLALIAASSPWFTTIAYACQGQGGGC